MFYRFFRGECSRSPRSVVVYKELAICELKKIGLASIATVISMCGTLLLFSPGVASAGTTGDREAVADAKQYLSFEAFSLQGLISQVEFDGFSAAQATYGAEHSGANWNTEAYKDAKQYLSTEAFSLGGLISQLEYDKFTAAQATYGAEHSGANWNTEAYKDAKQYLSTEAFSLGGLISQLEYDKFTAAQATYGAKKAY